MAVILGRLLTEKGNGKGVGLISPRGGRYKGFVIGIPSIKSGRG